MRDVAEGAQHLALGGEHDGGAGVPGLDETTSFDHGEFDGICDGECAGHGSAEGREAVVEHAQAVFDAARR